MAKTAPSSTTPSLTPWAQALSVATKSVTAPSSAGTTTNSQTGQVFQNATTGPYTKANAENIWWSTSVTPTPVSPTNAQNFAPNTLGAFTQANNWNLQAGQQAFQGFRKANYTPTPILPISQRTNLTPNATGGNMGEVKPIGGMTGSAKTGITPLKQENFGQSTKQITSTLWATKDDQDFLSNAFTKFTPAQQAEWNAMSQQQKLDSSKALLQGYRDTRDATIAKENLDYNHDLTVNAKTAQFQADVEQAQRNIATTNQNMALVTGMSGPLRSSDVASATSNAIANSQATYNNLVRSNDYEMAQLANNYQVATKSLLNAYNDRVSTTTQKLLSNISALDATGEFGTKLGLLKGQDLIDQALNDNLNSQQFLADRMNMISKIALEQQTIALAQAKIDDGVTKTINDGYAYNSNGIRLKNANGEPIKAQIQMSDQEKLDAQYAQAVKLKQMEIDQQNNTPRIIGTDEFGDPIYGTINWWAYKTWTVTNPVWQKSNQYLNLPVGAKWGTCGVFANRSVGLAGEPGGDDTLQGRTNTYIDKAPIVGGLAFFHGQGYDQKNWHVAMVKSVNQDGTMTIRDSNFKNDETVQERTIPITQAKGFYNNTPLAKANNWPREYTATDTALFDKFLTGKDDKNDAKKLSKLWYTQDDVNQYAKNKPKTTQLSDDQRAVYNSQLSSFRGNQVIKDYEQQIGQVSNIVASLWANSWPWDIASIFSFMKTLDPASTVREGEFALAAKSAGLVGTAENILSKLENGEMLNDVQKKQFAQLSKKYLENKSSQYDRLYDDMARVTKLSGIPDDYLPKRASEAVKSLSTTSPVTNAPVDQARVDKIKALIASQQ